MFYIFLISLCLIKQNVAFKMDHQREKLDLESKITNLLDLDDNSRGKLPNLDPENDKSAESNLTEEDNENGDTLNGPEAIPFENFKPIESNTDAAKDAENQVITDENIGSEEQIRLIFSKLKKRFEEDKLTISLPVLCIAGASLIIISCVCGCVLRTECGRCFLSCSPCFAVCFPGIKKKKNPKDLEMGKRKSHCEKKENPEKLKLKEKKKSSKKESKKRESVKRESSKKESAASRNRAKSLSQDYSEKICLFAPDRDSESNQYRDSQQRTSQQSERFLDDEVSQTSTGCNPCCNTKKKKRNK